MATTLTLSELLDRDVELTCADAVALVQLVMFEANITSARAPYGPPSLDNIALADDGSVHCMHTAATPSLVEAALLLQGLVARAHDRVPGGLRYAIGRALLEVEAPPFDTLDDFSTALMRFESGDRAERVSQLYNVATRNRHSPTIPAAASLRTDRRRHEPNPAELRRQLREADLRLYEARQRAGSMSAKTMRSRRLKRAPIAACMAAGIALVAAGELSPSARARLAAIRHLSQPTPARPATPVPASADRSSPPLQPVAASEVATSHMAPTPSPKVQKTAAPASRTRPSVRSRRGVPPTAKSSRSAKRSTDRDRGVIARIRFEWDNPFR
jgi:hypothetical protein